MTLKQNFHKTKQNYKVKNFINLITSILSFSSERLEEGISYTKNFYNKKKQ